MKKILLLLMLVASPAAAQAKLKAIWERVPFNKDIALSAISCTSPETYWVAGDKSTILHTKDGGKNWQVQLGGDPEATDEDLADIFFLDATSGWAVTQRGRLMATTDGSTWAELGKLPSTSKSVRFTSTSNGFLLENSSSQSQGTLQRTSDGGKSWKPAYKCTVEATIDGLARKLTCMPRVIRFVTPVVGFLGGGAPINMGTDVAAFAKTTDGGETWKTMVIPETKHRIVDLLFWSPDHGLAVLDSGQAYWTADGGATWTGTVNAPNWKSFYGSGEGKLVAGIRQNGDGIGYSTNGGRSFSSRPFKVPAEVRAVTFFDARNGYLVGKSGMVYRYRIVPADYTSTGMIAAAAAQ